MNIEVNRIKEIYSDYANAMQRLKEAIREDINKGNIIIDGTIQRFEFSFELAWKLARAILNYNGVQVETPKQALKEAFKAKMIEDGDGWIDMLEDRNKTSHIYDEKAALGIYNKIRNNHFYLLEKFENSCKFFFQ